MKIDQNYQKKRTDFIFGGGIWKIAAGVLCGIVGLLLSQLPTFLSLPPEIVKILPVFAVILLLISTLLLFVRRIIRLDFARKQISRWWGLNFLPLPLDTKPFSEFNAVEIDRQLHRSKNHHFYTYPVILKTASDSAMTINDQQDIIIARRLAESCARQLCLPLTDRSGSVPTIRNHDELDLSIRQIAVKREQVPERRAVEPMPDSLRELGDWTGDQLELIAPPEKLFSIIKKFLWIPFVLSTMGMTVFLWQMIPATDDQIAKIAFPIFIAVILLSLPLSIFAINRKISKLEDFTRLKATPQQLEIYYRRRRLVWQADEIEELLLLPAVTAVSAAQIPAIFKPLTMHLNGGIMVRSDRLYGTFGYRFSGTEQQWLYQALYAILAGK